MTSVLETLLAVKGLLNGGENWCQKATARGKSGRSVNFDGRAACKWCLDGALMKVVTNFSPEYYAAVNALKTPEKRRFAYITFNDTHTWPEVEELLDRAIEEARNE